MSWSCHGRRVHLLCSQVLSPRDVSASARWTLDADSGSGDAPPLLRAVVVLRGVPVSTGPILVSLAPVLLSGGDGDVPRGGAEEDFISFEVVNSERALDTAARVLMGAPVSRARERAADLALVCVFVRGAQSCAGGDSQAGIVVGPPLEISVIRCE
jgi:hypothetical protein